MSNSAKSTRKTKQPDPHTTHPLNVVEQAIHEIRDRKLALMEARYDPRIPFNHKKTARHLLDLLEIWELQIAIDELKAGRKALS